MPVLYIKSPAPSAHGKAGVRGHAAPGHGVQDQVARLGKIAQDMGDQLGRDPAGPVIPEPVVTIIEFSLVPGPESPAKCFEPVMIIFALQGQGPRPGAPASRAFQLPGLR
jgi:hypothetical protein